MTATVHVLGRQAAPRALPIARQPHARPAPMSGEDGWLVDVGALARCRALLSGHATAPLRPEDGLHSLLDVPEAYAQFCRNHFAAVQRLHPELSWSEACQAYAIALSAHALLCDGLDEAQEALLARHWNSLRGDTGLDWQQARALVADGCSALARIDPLSIRR